MTRDKIAGQLSRRSFCGVLLGTTTLGGCLGRSPSATDSETNRSPTDTTTTTATETATATKRHTETATATTVGGTPTAVPLNTTSYGVAWPFGPDGVVGHTYVAPLDDGSTQAVLLTSEEDWNGFNQVVEAATEVSLAEYRFARETDFAEESVLVFQTNLSSGSSRLQVRAVEHVGTTEPKVTVREVRIGSQNDSPARVILVRLPDEGTSPTAAVIRFVNDSGETTVQAKRFEKS